MMNDSGLGTSRNVQGSPGYPNLGMSGLSSSTNSNSGLGTSLSSSTGNNNHFHQQHLQMQQLSYTQINNNNNNNNPTEFLKNPNIFKRVYEELKLSYRPSVNPSHKKKLPLSKPYATPVKLELLDGLSAQVVCGAQLSFWHDTAGPGIEQLWSTCNENSENLSQEFVTFIARQTLCGYDISIESEEMRFNIYLDQNMMVPSIIFNSRYHDKLTKLALSIYLDLSKLSIYQQCHDFVSDRLSILASFTLKNFSNNIYDLTSFTTELTNVCTNFENVFTSTYPVTDISQTFFMDNNAPPQQDLDFFIRAVSSHIITSGSTVVVGTKQNEILKWLDTLCLFLTPNERNISSRQVSSHDVVPDLMIQGVINVGLRQIEDKLPFSLRPTTVIDIDKKEVYHTDILHQYTSFREDFLINAFILHQKSVKETKILLPFTQPSSFIKQMITEVFNLPICYRELYLVYFMKMLLRKASLAHSYIQSISNGGLNYQKLLKTFMNLPFESDANLLFGIAEKIQLNLFMTAIRKDIVMNVLASFDAF